VSSSIKRIGVQSFFQTKDNLIGGVLMTEPKLIQTKGSFSLTGLITGKDNPSKSNGYREGTVEKEGMNKGKKYRSIKFPLKTSEDNIITVELYGMEKDKVCFYNKALKKSVLVPWNQRNTPFGNGYELIMPEYDLVHKIHQNYVDGDSVNVYGEIEFSSYVDKNNETRESVKFIIKGCHHSDYEVEFDSPSFSEVNKFNQELVISEIIDNPKDKLVHINGYVIGYKEKFNSASFVIYPETSNPLFVKSIKSLKFGDFLKFVGRINNKAELIEIDDESGRHTLKSFTKNLEIVGYDKESFLRKRYKESDFYTSESTDVDYSSIIEKITDDELPF